MPTWLSVVPVSVTEPESTATTISRTSGIEVVVVRSVLLTEFTAK